MPQGSDRGEAAIGRVPSETRERRPDKMTEISLSHPLLLWVGLLPLAIILLQIFRASRRTARLRLSSYAWLPDAGREPVRSLVAARIARLFAMLCLTVLLAGLVGWRKETVLQPERSALILAVDHSSSMTADDFAPGNRLEEAKKHLGELIASRPDLDIGLIQFAAVPRLMSPATSDRPALLEALARVQPATYGGDGTAIGSALASSLNRLKAGPWKRRAVLLITDGVNNRGPLSPLDAAHIARLLGIPIYAVGLGSDTVTRFWVPVDQGRTAEVEARIEIDDEALRGLAAGTGGVYRRVRNSQELRRALAELPLGRGEERAVERSSLDPRWPRSLAVLAVLLLFVEFVVIDWIHSELPG